MGNRSFRDEMLYLNNMTKKEYLSRRAYLIKTTGIIKNKLGRCFDNFIETNSPEIKLEYQKLNSQLKELQKELRRHIKFGYDIGFIKHKT